MSSTPPHHTVPQNATNHRSCQESTSYSWLFTTTDATNYPLAPAWVSSCQGSINCSRHDPNSFNHNKQCRLPTFYPHNCLHWPLDNTQHSNEVIILKVRHVDPQQVRSHFLLNVLKQKYSGLKVTPEKSLANSPVPNQCTIYIFLTLQTLSKPCSSFWQT